MGSSLAKAVLKLALSKITLNFLSSYHYLLRKGITDVHNHAQLTKHWALEPQVS